MIGLNEGGLMSIYHNAFGISHAICEIDDFRIPSSCWPMINIHIIKLLQCIRLVVVVIWLNTQSLHEMGREARWLQSYMQKTVIFAAISPLYSLSKNFLRGTDWIAWQFHTPFNLHGNIKSPMFCPPNDIIPYSRHITHRIVKSPISLRIFYPLP